MNPPRAILALSGWTALATTALPGASPLRVAATAAFVLVCPGLAAVLLCTGRLPGRAAGRTALLESVTLAGAVSIALAALVAEVLFLVRVFTPERALLALALLTSAAVLASGLRPRGTPAATRRRWPARPPRPSPARPYAPPEQAHGPMTRFGPTRV
ncbi:hypothetical protein SZN_37486, partial [Streptomyces zinciresistens K42]